MRHASLIAASENDYPDSRTLPSGLHSTPQRLLFFIAGPLVKMLVAVLIGLTLFLDSFLMTFELSATTTVNGDAQLAL